MLPIPVEFKGRAAPADPSIIVDIAKQLDCDVAAVSAVAEVETRGDPFDDEGRPRILFERHIFHRVTDGAFDQSHPNVSAPTPYEKYGSFDEQYDKLAEAMTADASAAFKAASWGRFQILGVNFRAAGFERVEDMVAAFCDSEDAHYHAFAEFVESNNLVGALRAKNWARFARRYNGPGYRANRYDEKMARAYRRHAGGMLTGVFRVEGVEDLQIALNWMGANAGLVDGMMGPRTIGALKRFQKSVNLPEGGVPNSATFQAVQAAYYALGGPERV